MTGQEDVPLITLFPLNWQLKWISCVLHVHYLVPWVRMLRVRGNKSDDECCDVKGLSVVMNNDEQ